MSAVDPRLLPETAVVSPDGTPVRVKLRNTHVPIAATVFGESGGAARVVLAEAESAVTPGQACVFYDGARVLGGGWIARGGAAIPIAHNQRSKPPISQSV